MVMVIPMVILNINAVVMIIIMKITDNPLALKKTKPHARLMESTGRPPFQTGRTLTVFGEEILVVRYKAAETTYYSLSPINRGSALS